MQPNSLSVYQIRKKLILCVNEFMNIWEQSTPLNEAWIQSYKREYDLRKQTDPILHIAEAKIRRW